MSVEIHSPWEYPVPDTAFWCDPPFSLSNHEIRYSQGNKGISEVRNFPWEYPVPDTAFWRDLPWALSAAFLKNFTREKLQQLSAAHFERVPNTDKAAKLELLAQLLHTKLGQQETTAAAGSQGSQTLFAVDYNKWRGLWMGIAAIQLEAGQRAEAEVVTRMLHQTRRDAADLIHLHTLAGIVLGCGRYSEAERMASEVKVWLDGRLGRDSPQALAARRMLVKAKWERGLREAAKDVLEEANNVLLEIRDIVDGEVGEGKYAVYKHGEHAHWQKLAMELAQRNHWGILGR